MLLGVPSQITVWCPALCTELPLRCVALPHRSKTGSKRRRRARSPEADGATSVWTTVALIRMAVSRIYSSICGPPTVSGDRSVVAVNVILQETVASSSSPAGEGSTHTGRPCLPRAVSRKTVRRPKRTKESDADRDQIDGTDGVMARELAPAGHGHAASSTQPTSVRFLGRYRE